MTEKTQPTDKELEAFAVEEQFLLFCDVDEFTQIARAVLAKWGTLRAEKIVTPTDTMEQEFQNHYRRGYEAGKKAATPQPTQTQDDALILQLVESLENSHATLWEEDDDPSRPVHAAIAAGRARLEGKP